MNNWQTVKQTLIAVVITIVIVSTLPVASLHVDSVENLLINNRQT